MSTIKAGAESGATSVSKEAVKVVFKNVPRSTPASGRWWKPVQKQRFSAMKVKNKKSGINRSWARKLAERQRRKEMKELEAGLKALKEQKQEQERLKRAEKRKRKAENTLKNVRMQPIKNIAKLKKMNKKQLRSVKKTRIDSEGNVQLVGAYE